MRWSSGECFWRYNVDKRGLLIIINVDKLSLLIYNKSNLNIHCSVKHQIMRCAR